MKKFLSLLLLAALLMLCFASCGDSKKKGGSDDDEDEDGDYNGADYNMSVFINNLGSNYSTREYSDPDEIQSIIEYYGVDLDPSDYGATMGITATNMSTYCMVVIIECDSEENASALKADCAAIVEYLENSYSSSYSFDAKAVGNYVLVGEVSAMNDALEMAETGNATTMSEFLSNLGNSYSTREYSDPDEIQSIIAYYGVDLDPSDYGATVGITATNMNTYCMVVIIECDSASSASALKVDCAAIVECLENSYSSSYSFDAVVAGNFVLVGEVSAINDALGA